MTHTCKWGLEYAHTSIGFHGVVSGDLSWMTHPRKWGLEYAHTSIGFNGVVSGDL